MNEMTRRRSISLQSTNNAAAVNMNLTLGFLDFSTAGRLFVQLFVGHLFVAGRLFVQFFVGHLFVAGWLFVQLFVVIYL